MFTKNFFAICLFLSLFFLAFNSTYIIVRGNEVSFDSELEAQVPTLFDKGILICKEISDVSNFRVINSINSWYANLRSAKVEKNSSNEFGHGGSFTGGNVSTLDVFDFDNNVVSDAWGYVIYYGSLLLLPVDLTLNFCKLIFNCVNILIGSQISITARG